MQESWSLLYRGGHRISIFLKEGPKDATRRPVQRGPGESEPQAIFPVSWPWADAPCPEVFMLV
jgi:hypothetical protein